MDRLLHNLIGPRPHCYGDDDVGELLAGDLAWWQRRQFGGPAMARPLRLLDRPASVARIRDRAVTRPISGLDLLAWPRG